MTGPIRIARHIEQGMSDDCYLMFFQICRGFSAVPSARGRHWIPRGPPALGIAVAEARAGSSRGQILEEAAPSTVRCERQEVTRIRTLEELLTLVPSGDPSVFSEIYDQTASLVYGLVLRIVRAPSIAEEVTQEVYLQIWRQSGGFDAGKGSARTWITTIAHRRAVDAVRSNQSARTREMASPADPLVPDVAEAAIESDERQKVRVALGELTVLQRDSIELAYFDGLTYRQVAEHLDIPLGTVKTRMRDGLLRLRSALGVSDD